LSQSLSFHSHRISLDQAANSAVIQMESQYQAQMKEYQSNITHAIEETDKLRTELKQFQEQNHLKEKQNQDLINSLKHDNEKIQTELKHRGKSTILRFIILLIPIFRTSSKFHLQRT
jgi:cell shape-determining protein MreC